MNYINHTLKTLCATHPEKIALQTKNNGVWQTVSYRELDAHIQKNRQLLIEMGLSAGDQILLFSETCIEGILAYLTILSIAAIPVLPDPNLPPETLFELTASLHAQAILITDRYLPLLPGLKNLKLPARNIQKFFEYCSEIDTVPLSTTQKTAKTATSLACILFTSGTTSHFKAVQLSHHNLFTAITSNTQAVGFHHTDRVLVFLPIYHISGLLACLTFLCLGATVTTINQVDGKRLIEDMQATQPTYMHVVPLVLERFLAQIEEKITEQSFLKKTIIHILLQASQQIRKLTGWNVGKKLFGSIQAAFGSQLKILFSLGAAPDLKTILKLEAMGFTIVNVYGLTETTGTLCSDLNIKIKKPNLVGLPLNGMQIKIHPSGDEAGEILIKGPLLTIGYLNEPAHDEETWFATGDNGFIDAKGYLYITGRNKELIVFSSGKKIMPHTVESYYKNIPGIKELAVIGIPSSCEKGENIHAVVILEQASKATVEEIIFSRASQLPAFLQIKQIHVVTEIPKTSSLKIKRTLLKKQITEKLFIDSNHNSSPAKYPSIPFPHLDAHSSPAILEKWICCWLANTQQVPLLEIDVTKPIFYYQSDSFTLAQFYTEISDAIKRDLNFSNFLSCESITALAEKITTYLQTPTHTIKPSLKTSPALSAANIIFPLFPMNFTELGFWLRSEKKLAHTLSIAFSITTSKNPSEILQKTLIGFSEHQLTVDKKYPLFLKITDKNIFKKNNWLSKTINIENLTEKKQQHLLEKYFLKNNQKGKWRYFNKPLIRAFCFALDKNIFEIHLHFSHLIFDYRAAIAFIGKFIYFTQADHTTDQKYVTQPEIAPTTLSQPISYENFNHFSAYKSFIRTCVSSVFPGTTVKKSWLKRKNVFSLKLSFLDKNLSHYCEKILCLKNELVFALFFLAYARALNQFPTNIQFYQENRDKTPQQTPALASGIQIKLADPTLSEHDAIKKIIEQIRKIKDKQNDFSYVTKLHYVHVAKKHLSSKLFKRFASIINSYLFPGIIKNLYTKKVTDIFSLCLLSTKLLEIKNIFSLKNQVILTYIDNSSLEKSTDILSQTIKKSARKVDIYQMVKSNLYKNVISIIHEDHCEFKFYHWPGSAEALEKNLSREFYRLLKNT